MGVASATAVRVWVFPRNEVLVCCLNRQSWKEWLSRKPKLVFTTTCDGVSCWFASVYSPRCATEKVSTRLFGGWRIRHELTVRKRTSMHASQPACQGRQTFVG